MEALDGAVGERALPVGLVIVSEYRAGARFRARRLSQGQGLLAILANTVSARRQPEAALGVLQKVSAGARVYKGARGEADAAAASILRLLEES